MHNLVAIAGPGVPDPSKRTRISDCGDGACRAVIRYGLLASPDLPEALKEIDGCKRAAWFLSRLTLIPTRRPGMARWREHLSAAMTRNAKQPMTFFRLPVDRFVELGSQVEI